MSETPQQRDVSVQERGKKWWSRGLRFIRRAFVRLVLTVLVVLGIIALPPVQSYIIDKATQFLSAEWQTAVKIESFYLNAFDELTLKGVYVGNQNAPQDTLAYIGKLRVDVNYVNLAWGILQLDAVRLEHADVRLWRSGGQLHNNLQFIIDYFDPPSTEKRQPKAPFDFRVAQVHLRDIHFSQDDKVRGRLLAVYLKAADIHTNIMNLPKGLLDLTRVNVFEPQFIVEDYPRQPIAPDVLAAYRAKFPRDTADQGTKKPFLFNIGAISVEGGTLVHNNWRKSPMKTTPKEILDFFHLNVFDININIHNFIYAKDEFRGVVDGISLRDESGFVLNKMTVSDAKVSPTETALYGLQIETPNSVVGDTLRFMYNQYTDFEDFNDHVVMDARIHASKVLIDDIMTFAPKLEKNTFFVKNRQEFASIDGNLFGKVNTLKIRPFKIQLGRGLYAEGTLDSRDLDNRDETFMILNLDKLRTNMPALRELIPNFKPGLPYNRLGELDFEGTFTGFFNNFTAEGALKTALGEATMDLQLRPPTTGQAAGYSGNLDLRDFDLGALTDEKKLGKVTLKASILKGEGFSLDKIKAEVSSTIESVYFNGYDYKAINLKGNMRKGLFDGSLESRDPNVDFVFDGTIDFSQKTPIFKFTSNINRLAFQKLNLMRQDLALSGKIDLDVKGTKLSELQGYIDLRQLALVKNGVEHYNVDSLVVHFQNDLDTGQTIALYSEILTARLYGFFYVEDIPEAFFAKFTKYHPRLAADLGLTPRRLQTGPNGYGIAPINYTFLLDVKDTKNLTYLFDYQLDTLRRIRLNGYFEDSKNLYGLEISAEDEIRYGDVRIVESVVDFESNKEVINWNASVYSVLVGKDQYFRDFKFENLVVNDVIKLGLTSENLSDRFKLGEVELDAEVIRQDSAYRVQLGGITPSFITVAKDKWYVDNQNAMFIGKRFLDVQGLQLYNDKEASLTFQSQGQRGLSVALDRVNIDFVNSFINDNRFTFSGQYHVEAEVEDVFKFENFQAKATFDTIRIGKEQRGKLEIDVSGQSLKKPINTNITLSTDTSNVRIEGNYYPTATEEWPSNSIEYTIDLKRLPFRTMTLLIEEGASGFKGVVDGRVRVSGPLKEVNTEGVLHLRDAEVTVDYLRIPIRVKDGAVRINNTSFDATNAIIYDAADNKARITGGLTHNRFQDFGLNLKITSDNFTFLNTTRDDNPLYYGKAVGKGDVKFTGDFRRTNINIYAKAGKGTNITFPFATEQTAKETAFVVFKDKNTAQNIDSSKLKVKELRGIDLDMALDITPDAETNLIFDEVAGDNIRAHGSGNFNFSFKRDGNLTMDGEYRIDRGDYLFTLLRVVNKNFNIKQGGTIRWNGTPFDATLNIEAEYARLKTAPYNFIAEYISNFTEAESRKPTEVNLKLKLTGPLLKPDINFDIDFPNLQNPLKSYAESKLRLLRQDVNELNRQVFGLVVVGGFLPDATSATDLNNQIAAGGINTLTETVSSVLSSTFNKLLSEYVKGIDVEFGYNYYQFSLDPSNPNRSAGQQFRLRSSYTLNDKVTLSGGVGVESGDYLQNTVGSNVFVGGDFIVDYAVSADRRLKLRLSGVYDQVVEGRRYKSAAGLRFREEADTFEEFIQSLRRSPRKPPSVQELELFPEN